MRCVITRLIATAMLLIVASGTANAANVWHYNARIARIYPMGGSSSFVLKFDVSSTACTNVNSYYYVTVGQNGITEAGAKSLLAVAMLGMATGNPISVLFDNASSSCQVNTLFVDAPA